MSSFNIELSREVPQSLSDSELLEGHSHRRNPEERNTCASLKRSKSYPYTFISLSKSFNEVISHKISGEENLPLHSISCSDKISGVRTDDCSSSHHVSSICDSDKQPTSLSKSSEEEKNCHSDIQVENISLKDINSEENIFSAPYGQINENVRKELNEEKNENSFDNKSHFAMNENISQNELTTEENRKTSDDKVTTDDYSTIQVADMDLINKNISPKENKSISTPVLFEREEGELTPDIRSPIYSKEDTVSYLEMNKTEDFNRKFCGKLQDYARILATESKKLKENLSTESPIIDSLKKTVLYVEELNKNLTLHLNYSKTKGHESHVSTSTLCNNRDIFQDSSNQKRSRYDERKTRKEMDRKNVQNKLEYGKETCHCENIFCTCPIRNKTPKRGEKPKSSRETTKLNKCEKYKSKISGDSFLRTSDRIDENKQRKSESKRTTHKPKERIPDTRHRSRNRSKSTKFRESNFRNRSRNESTKKDAKNLEQMDSKEIKKTVNGFSEHLKIKNGPSRDLSKTKIEKKRVISLFQRQMNLINKHVIRVDKSKLKVLKKLKSNNARDESFHEKDFDVTKISSLEDMEAFLRFLKQKKKGKFASSVTDNNIKKQKNVNTVVCIEEKPADIYSIVCNAKKQNEYAKSKFQRQKGQGNNVAPTTSIQTKRETTEGIETEHHHLTKSDDTTSNQVQGLLEFHKLNEKINCSNNSCSNSKIVKEYGKLSCEEGEVNELNNCRTRSNSMHKNANKDEYLQRKKTNHANKSTDININSRTHSKSIHRNADMNDYLESKKTNNANQSTNVDIIEMQGNLMLEKKNKSTSPERSVIPLQSVESKHNRHSTFEEETKQTLLRDSAENNSELKIRSGIWQQQEIDSDKEQIRRAKRSQRKELILGEKEGKVGASQNKEDENKQTFRKNKRQRISSSESEFSSSAVDNEEITDELQEDVPERFNLKNVYILADKKLDIFDGNWLLRFYKNRIYLQRAEKTHRNKLKSRRKQNFRIKPDESELHRVEMPEVKENPKNADDEFYSVPGDPKNEETTLEEMEAFLRQLRAKKKEISNDGGCNLPELKPQAKEVKFLDRIRAKRKAKLMACVSTTPEKEAKFLKALEEQMKVEQKRDLDNSSDEEYKRKLMQKIRAETDAIILGNKFEDELQKRIPNLAEGHLVDVKTFYPVLRGKVELKDVEEYKKFDVSFALKRSDVKNPTDVKVLEIATTDNKQAPLSTQTHRVLNALRAKLRAKKTTSGT